MTGTPNPFKRNLSPKLGEAPTLLFFCRASRQLEPIFLAKAGTYAHDRSRHRHQVDGFVKTIAILQVVAAYHDVALM